MATVAKVTKIELGWIFTPEGKLAFPYDALFEVQRQVAKAKNKTIQLCWEWNNFGADFRSVSGTFPKPKDVIGKSLDGYIYSLLNSEYDAMYSMNLNAAIRNASSDFQNALKDIQRGERSILSYRKDVPIEIHNSLITFAQHGSKVSLKVFSTKYQKEKAFASNAVEFDLAHLQGSPKEIVQRCMSGAYKIGESKLIWIKKKRKWFLHLTYKFTPAPVELDPKKIMGVDLGIACVAYMGFRFTEDRASIPGHEVETSAKKWKLGKSPCKGREKYAATDASVMAETHE